MIKMESYETRLFDERIGIPTDGQGFGLKRVVSAVAESPIPIVPIAGGLTSVAGMGYVHELGHYLVGRSFGCNPSIHLSVLDDWFVQYGQCVTPLSRAQHIGMAAGGDALLYATVLGLNVLSNAMNNSYRSLVKGMSTIMGFLPAVYSIGDAVTGHIGDYHRLNNLGVGYVITIPLTLGLGLANAYLANKTIETKYERRRRERREHLRQLRTQNTG